MGTDGILDKINLDRIADDLWTLVSIPSPTGNERKVLHAYAEMLEKAGAAVELEGNGDDLGVIGRLKRGGSRTFQLAGHADHIDMPHATPTRTAEIISGRGASDMKGGLSAILEMVRVIAEHRDDLPGDLLVTVYGGHEAPVGESSALNRLIRRGIVGDAAMVVESAEPLGAVVVHGAGQSIWNLSVRWEGQVCHELRRPLGADGIWDTTTDLVHFLRAYGRELEARESHYPLLRPESLFIGQIHGGDFYNRTASMTSLQGTRRWHPNRDFRSVREEFSRLLSERVAPRLQVSVGVDWNFVGESYEVDPDETIVKAHAEACRTVVGAANLSGTMVVTDAARLARLGKVPTVVCAFDNDSAHADHEFVRLSRILEACKVAVLTVTNYFESATERNLEKGK